MSRNLVSPEKETIYVSNDLVTQDGKQGKLGFSCYLEECAEGLYVMYNPNSLTFLS